MHRTILVATTADEAGREALALGVELARPLGAGVVLAGVVTDPGSPGDEELHRRLEALRGSGPPDVPITIETIDSGSILRGLHDLALQLGAELLVLGHSHRGWIRRSLMGDLTADAVFTAPCAVAVAARGQAVAVPQRVGVAWDATPEADEALEWAVQLVERVGGELRIVRVVEARRDAEPPEADAAAELEAVRVAAERRVQATAILREGDPAIQLQQVEQDLDLLVMGSRGRGPKQRTMLGSVSADVLHHARCSVVVLPRGVVAPVDTAAV